MDDEVMFRQYSREEEFLKQHGHGGIVPAALSLPEFASWNPKGDASDQSRKQQAYFQRQGHVPDELYFDGATIYQRDSRLSSVLITLKSTTRVVAARMTREKDGSFTAVLEEDKKLE